MAEPTKQPFSAFAAAKDAVKRATVSNNSLVITLPLEDAQSNAVSSTLLVGCLMPMSPKVLNITQSGLREKIFSDEPAIPSQFRWAVGNKNEEIIVQRDGANDITTLKIPLLENVGEKAAKTTLIGAIAGMQQMTTMLLQHPIGTTELTEDTLATGTYEVFGFRHVAEAQVIGRMLAAVAHGHGYSNHVHTMLRPANFEHPLVLVKEDIRQQLLAAEMPPRTPGTHDRK